MVFNSYIFLIFFPVVLIVYRLIPKKARSFWLLAASYYFYMSWNPKYAVLIVFSTVATYITGILLDRCRSRKDAGQWDRSKLIVAACITVNLMILFFFKYYGFFFDNLTALLSHAGIAVSVPRFDVVLPVGISFYTFQALGYCIDVYRGDTKAEHNFWKYALFVSFFPQLVAGPIERSGNLMKQLEDPAPYSYTGFRDGLFLMLWGYFQKIVIADRIAVFVDAVYGDVSSYPGVYLIVATVLFALQIYCDFGGYSNIAKGAAGILGIELMDNFASPYLSQNCAGFWKRWHISLSSWFRDYVYIPLGGNRKGKLRKYLNILIVFGASGLWHGANWTYVLWGLLNGLFQIAGDAAKNLKQCLGRIFSVDADRFASRAARVAVTFVLICFTWIFFRADTVGEAFDIIYSMASVHNPWVLFDGSLYLTGLTQKEMAVLVFSVLILIAVDIANYKGIRIRKLILEQDYWFRALAFAVCVCVILIFGIWGTGYRSDAFLYFQF